MARRPQDSLGEMIDTLYDARESRQFRQKEMEAEIAALKEREAAIENEILNRFTAHEIEAARGRKATAALKTTKSASVKNMPALWAWAKKHDAVDLFIKRVNSAAYNERIESGDVIPGVETFVKKDLSLTAVRK